MPGEDELLADVKRAQREISDAMNAHNEVQAAMQAHRELQASVRDAMHVHDSIREAMWAHEEAQRLVYGPIREAIRAHQEMQDAIYGPIREAMRAHEEAKRLVYGPIQEAMRAHREMQDAVYVPIREAMRAHEEAKRLITDLRSASKMVAGLSAITGQLVQVPHIQLNEAIASALQEVETETEDTESVKAWTGFPDTGHDAERRELESQLASKVEDFASLPTSGKIVQLLDIVIANPSSAVGTYAFGVASGLLGDMLGEADMSKVLVKSMWLLMFLLFGIVAQLSVKLRVPKTRQILRTLPIGNENSRIVTHTCMISSRPKSRSTKVGWLTVGAVVTVTDSFKGWRQVYFTVGSQERVGWVRSKYLRTI